MKKDCKILNVQVSWTGDNFCGGLYDREIEGAVIVTNKTLEGLKKDFEEALKFHIEGCEAGGDIIPEYLVRGDYRIKYELDATALLKDAEKYTTLTAISKITGINVKQLSHYANGQKKARRPQRDRIICGLHELGRHFLALG